MAIFDGHNDLLLNLWLHHREDPVSAFFAGIENGHLDYPRIRQGGLAGGRFRPERLVVVGGPAPGLAADVGAKLGMAVDVPEDFDVANALGAFLGGLVIAAGWGVHSTPLVGVVLSVLGLIVVLVSLSLQWRSRQRSSCTANAR